jgi:hypothetical protein
VADEEKKEIVTVDEIEALLEQLPGVINARIVVNDWGAIEEAHILSTSERNPKQVVRDVESALAAKWGINIDHKKVSVAQLSGQKTGASPVRLKILHVALVTDAVRNQIEARVVLSRAGDEDVQFEGIARATISLPQNRRALAQATLAAVNKVLESDYSFLLEEVASYQLGQREVVVVTVTLLTPRGNEESLVGAVTNKGDLNGAVVKATLDGINRRLGKVATFPKPEHRADRRPPEQQTKPQEQQARPGAAP